MSLKTERFDGVTAPALPPLWVFDSGFATTATFLSFITPLSSPNALSLGPTSSAARSFATWQTPDSLGGDVQVDCSFNASDDNGRLAFGVFARSNASAPTIGASTFYLAEIDVDRSQVHLRKVVAGTLTTLATVGTLGLTVPQWYALSFRLAGTALTVTVVRASDGFTLNSGGTFQSAATSAIALTDSSIAGSGFTGLTAVAVTDRAYIDNWALGAPGDIPAFFVLERPDVPALMAASIAAATVVATEARDTLVALGSSVTLATIPAIERPDSPAIVGLIASAGVGVWTESHDTSGFSAAFASIATLVRTEGHDTAAIAGDSPRTATLTATERHDTLVALGSQATAVLTATERHDVLVAPARAGITGSLGATEGHDVLVALATASTAATLGVSAGSDVFAGLAEQPPTAALGVTTPDDVLVALGFVDNPTFIAVTEAPDSVGSGFVGVMTCEGVLSDSPAGDDQFAQGSTLKYNIYANSGVGDPINYDTPIATTGLLTYTTGILTCDGKWQFGVRAFDPGSGLEEQNLDCSVTIILDEFCTDVTSRPLPPFGLRAFAVAP